ncbi:hypothetical protein OAA27_01765 [bacterium]|nr:hypothetical protein [bacterium]
MYKLKHLILTVVSIALLTVTGCTDPQQSKWDAFDRANDSKSFSKALGILKEIKAENPDATHPTKDGSVDGWITEWESIVEISNAGQSLRDSANRLESDMNSIDSPFN